jgi:hypothetical protein
MTAIRTRHIHRAVKIAKLPSPMIIAWWKLRSAVAPRTSAMNDGEPRIVVADHHIAENAEGQCQHRVLDAAVHRIGADHGDGDDDGHENA